MAMLDSKCVEEILLDGTTEATVSKAVYTGNCNALTFHIIATNVSSGAVLEIQSSLDNSNWVTINTSTKTIATTGNTEVTSTGKKYKYARANISSYTDGTYTVTLFGGN